MSIWKRKLVAYLHDPPSKSLDLRKHEESARLLIRQAGLVDEVSSESLSALYSKPSDWLASAADRFPFPNRNFLTSSFDGVTFPFRHPLSPGVLKFSESFASSELAMEVDQGLQPVAVPNEELSDDEQWRIRFFAHWRLWEAFCSKKDYRMAFLPADTRIPDHPTWTHMQVVSCLDSTAHESGKESKPKPAFLKFQLGPVQEFIAEARSIRDLWSGSYLLSWLMARGLKELALEVGPDSVIFPNLKGQPLVDLHLRKHIWDCTTVNSKNGWAHIEELVDEDQMDSLSDSDRSGKKPKHNSHLPFLTPNLPNVFVAVVPAERAAELGEIVERAIREEWSEIARHVWEYCDEAEMIPEEEAGFMKAERQGRFLRQVEQFLSISWQTTPWPQSLEKALDAARSYSEETPVFKAAGRVQAVVDYSCQTMPEKDRDDRCYANHLEGGVWQLGLGVGWSLMLAIANDRLDAVRQTRDFAGWASGAWERGTFQNKDSLGGKAEAVAGGRDWSDRADKKGGDWKRLFKHPDWLSATTLIKRTWHLAYLKKPWSLKTGACEFTMPDTRNLADHRPFDEAEDSSDELTFAEGKYFAVLALDGDKIGKWVSGERTPKYESQFSQQESAAGNHDKGAVNYFRDNEGQKILNTQRLLSPSYHLQFSQALSNFALLCARRIVEAHQGRLIYAGGDDVLAMLPADMALSCAVALRDAFQGREVEREKGDILSRAPGFLSIKKDQQGNPISFIVPGPEADCSAGIAIAHYKAPLQDVVREAQRAEKRAKQNPPKNENGDASTLAVTVMKRSGEIQNWDCKWDSGGIEASEILLRAMKSNCVSAKFPHRVIEYLEPLSSRPGSEEGEQIDGGRGNVTTAPDFSRRVSIDIVSRFVELTADQQTGSNCDVEEVKKVVDSVKEYAETLTSPERVIRDIIGLMTVTAFASRTAEKRDENE